MAYKIIVIVLLALLGGLDTMYLAKYGKDKETIISILVELVLIILVGLLGVGILAILGIIGIGYIKYRRFIEGPNN